MSVRVKICVRISSNWTYIDTQNKSFSFCFSYICLFCFVLFYSEILGREEQWHILLCVPALFSVVQIIVLPFLPEAPRYLFIEKGDEKACIKGWYISPHSHIHIHMQHQTKELATV